MKKGAIFILLIVFLVFVNTNIVSANSSFFRFLGGRITNTKATEVQIYESMGYVCPAYGTTISIMPIGSPSGTPIDYIIPYFVIPQTRTVPRTGQLILGRYGGVTTVACTKLSPPDVRTVMLPTINLFGTSR